MLENGLYVFVGSYGVLKGLFVLKYKYRPFVYFVCVFCQRSNL